jgi:hypothetical protein
MVLVCLPLFKRRKLLYEFLFSHDASVKTNQKKAVQQDVECGVGRLYWCVSRSVQSQTQSVTKFFLLPNEVFQAILAVLKQ